MKFLKIDELNIDDHSRLSPNDECFYFMEYTSGTGYTYSEANDLISNLKKKLDKKGTPQWKYKGRAIKGIGEFMANEVASTINFATTTIVPIPPSKVIGDVMYDNRLNQILDLGCKDYEADIRNLILLNENMIAVHEGGVRPSVEELVANMRINENEVNDLKQNIILFDDVLTAGTHFKACQRIINIRFPDIKVYGIFIARRAIIEQDYWEFFL